MDFHELKRKALQALCKKHNIDANGTNLDMADQLTSLLKKPILEPKRKKGLVGNDETRGENESKIITRQAKKVMFCLEEENVQDVNSKKKNFDSSVSQKRSLMKPAKQNVVETPLRMTRSRKGIELVVFSPFPTAKKKTRRGEKKDEMDNGVRNSSTPVVLSESVSQIPVRTTRSRRGTDLVVTSSSPVAKKKTRRRGEMAESVSGVENASTALVLSDNNISGSSAIKEDSVRVTRSLRSKGILLEGVDLNLKKKDTSSRKRTREVRGERQSEFEVGDVAMENTRQTRSRKKDNELVNNVSNSQIVKRSKRIGSAPAKSVRIDSKKVKEVISDNVVQIVIGESKSVPKPENAPRRSKRNAVIEEDAVQSDGQSRTNGMTGDVSVLKRNTRQSRSRKQNNEQVNNVTGSQIIKEESKYASKPEEKVMRRSRRIDPATDYSGILNGANVKEAISDNAPRRSKRNAITEEDAVQSRTKGVIGNKVSAVVRESQNASKLEQATRRSRRSSATIQLSGVTGNHKPGKNSSKIEDSPRMSIVRASNRKFMASTNVRVEQPVRRRKQNSANIENVALTDVAVTNEEDGRNIMVPEQRVRGFRKSKSSVGKSYSILEELPRRSTRGGSRRESIAMDSRVAVSSDLKLPNIPGDERAAQKKGKTTSGGCRGPKPRAKTSSGKQGRGKTVSKRTEQKSDIQEEAEGSTQPSPESGYQLELSCIKEVPEDFELNEAHMKLDLQVNATSEQLSQLLVDSTVLEGKVTVDDSLVVAGEESSHIVNEVKSVLTGGKLKTQVGTNISNHTEGNTRAASEIGLLKDGEHVGFQEAQPELISCVRTAVPKAFDIAGEVCHTVMEFQGQDEGALPSSTEESVALIAEASRRQCNVSEMDEPLILLEKADGETEKDAVMDDTILVEEIWYQDLEERPDDHLTALGTGTDKSTELVKVAPMEEPLERHYLMGEGKLEKDAMLVETTLVEVTTNEEQEYLDDNVTASETDHEKFEETVKVATTEKPLETAVVIGDGGHVRKVFHEVGKEGNAEASVEEFGGKQDEEVAPVMLRGPPETSGDHCTCEYEDNLAIEKEEADEAFECNGGRSVADDGYSGTSLLSQSCSPSLDDIMNVAADRKNVDFENKADFVEEGNEKDIMREVLEVPVNLRKDVSLELLGLVNTVTEDQISKVGDPLEDRTVMNTISYCKDGGIVADNEIAGISPLTQAYTPSNVENVDDEEENLDCGVVESEASLQQVPKELLELKQGEEEKMHKRCNVELDGYVFETDSFFSNSVESVSEYEVEARTSPLLSKEEAVSSGLISSKLVVLEQENSGSHLSQSFRQNTFKEASTEENSDNEIDRNSIQESWKTDKEMVEYHLREHADLKKDLDLEMHDLVDVVSGERDYKADQIFMEKQSMTAEREKAGKDDSDLDELVEEYPVFQRTHKFLLEVCETEKEIQVNAEASSGKICGEKSDNTASVCVGENEDTECLPFIDSEEHSGSTEAFIAEGNLWGDGAYSERTCKHVDGSLGTTHQILEELGDRENYVVHADGEDNGCFVPTPEFLSYEFCRDEKEDIQVNSIYQTELGNIREALPETAAVSSSYCSEIPLVNAALCQGDNTANEDAAIIQNRTCGEILEPKEMSEAIREDKGLTDCEIDSSLFTVDPSNDRIICNKQEREDHIDNATVSLPPDQVEDDGDGLEMKLVLSPKDFSNSNPNVNTTRDHGVFFENSL